jgi:membrane protein
LNPAKTTSNPRRGRHARSPAQIPLRGWKDILVRTWIEFNEDHILIIAGGVTFSILLAIFPALGAFVALYGLFGDVAQAPHQLAVLGVLLPSAAVSFIGDEMLRLSHARAQGLSLALAAGVVISLISANGAMKAIFVGMNVAYDTQERRGFFRLNLISLIFTLGLIAFLMAALVALGLGTAVSRLMDPDVAAAAKLGRWPALVAAFAAGLSLLYRFGPSRPKARWRWITWGGAAASLLWLITSLLFSLYVSRFAHYDRTYGPLGAALGVMLWSWLTVIIVLLGAELNAEIEQQVGAHDATGPANAPGKT